MKKIGICLAFCIMSSSVFASETAEGLKKDFVSFKQEMQVKLEATEKKIQELKKKAGDKSTEAQEKSIREYENKRDELKSGLEKIDKQSKTKWQKTKKRMAQALDKLNKKVQKSLEE